MEEEILQILRASKNGIKTADLTEMASTRTGGSPDHAKRAALVALKNLTKQGLVKTNVTGKAFLAPPPVSDTEQAANHESGLLDLTGSPDTEDEA
jgi:hypothetical protein